MGKVIEFPSLLVGEWTKFEREIYSIAHEMGYGDDVAAEVSMQIRPLFDILTEGFTLTVMSSGHNIPDYDWSHFSEFIGKILLERTNREFVLVAHARGL